MAKSAVVVGLGRFGSVLAGELTQLGYDVLGVDRRPERVRELAQSISKAVQGEATEPELWKELPVKGATIGVIAFSSSVEANVFTALLLRRVGIKQIIALSSSELHSELLRAIGVDRIIEPQVDSALRLAHTLDTRIEDYLEVTKGFAIAKIGASGHWKGMTLRKLQDDEATTVLVLLRGHRVMLEPPETEKIAEGDVLVLGGKDQDLRDLH